MIKEFKFKLTQYISAFIETESGSVKDDIPEITRLLKERLTEDIANNKISELFTQSEKDIRFNDVYSGESIPINIRMSDKIYDTDFNQVSIKIDDTIIFDSLDKALEFVKSNTKYEVDLKKSTLDYKDFSNSNIIVKLKS